MFKIKSLSMIAAAILVSAGSAQAALPGAYLGGQLGWDNIHQAGFSNSDMNELLGPGTTSSTSTSGNKGLGGRLFAGYQFNENWAVETGWTKFHNMSSRGTAVNGSTTVSASGTLKADALDVVAKGILPLQNNFSVFGKLGLAYLMERAKVSLTGAGVSLSDSDRTNKVYPTFGLGVGYDFTQNVSGDLSWTRIQKIGSNSSMASTDFIGLGLAYHFG